MKGAAAEHLVCADLLLGGWKAILAAQMCAYDVAVDVGGRLVRVQVKSTYQPRLVGGGPKTVQNSAYQWTLKRTGKGSAYSSEHCDVIALVALDTRRIAYLPVEKQRPTMHLYTTGSLVCDWADLSFSRSVAA